jgi:hypothetical protein
MKLIQIRLDLGDKPSDIVKRYGLKPSRVSYYLRKMGRSRPRSSPKDKSPRCIVCRKNLVSPALKYVCAEYSCIEIMLSTADCSNRLKARIDGEKDPVKVDSNAKIYYDIRKRTDKVFPKGAEVCILDGVDRVFSSDRDHMLYHAYRRDGGHRPPVILWKDETQWKAYRERRREEEWANRNRNSEHPQPRRIRGPEA